MKNRNIICLSMTTWEGDYMKAVVHMMGHLAKNNRVLFIDYAFTFKDLLMSIMGKSPAPWKKMIGFRPRTTTIHYQGHKLYHLTLPPILPINWISNPYLYDLINQFQIGGLFRFCIKKVLHQLHFTQPVLINAFNPVIGTALQRVFSPSRSIYYCYDEIAAAKWCNKHGKRLEAELIQHTDLTVTTSAALYASKSKESQNTVLIKNGVDFDLFHSAFHVEKNTQRPVVGYVGSIDFRLNYDLIAHLAGSLPHCDFRFVGRIQEVEAYHRLQQFENVTFLGAQQPDRLPELLSQMDVAIIPFGKNEFTRNIYPLKINEYLAAGLPVVTTHFADLSDFKQVVTIADSNEEFVHAINQAMTPDASRQKTAVDMAKANDWSARADQFENAIENMYEKAS